MTFEKELFYQQFSLKYVLLYQKVRYKLFSRPIVTLSSCIIKRPNYFIKWLRSTWTFSLNEKRDYNPIILLFTTTWNPMFIYLLAYKSNFDCSFFFNSKQCSSALFNNESFIFEKNYILGLYNSHNYFCFYFQLLIS